MPATDARGAALLAEALRAGVEALGIKHANSQVNQYITISLGVATLTPAPGSSCEELISAADKALYRAKQAGRNRVWCSPAADAAPTCGNTALNYTAAMASTAQAPRPSGKR